MTFALRRATRAGLLALVFGLVLVGVAAGPAAAHASLVSVDPPHGARLDESPAAVTLTFSEPVSVELGGVRVLDLDGQAVHEGAAAVDGVVVTLRLQPDLPAGTYVVSYRVISADGHPARGGSVFGVGPGAVDTTALGRVATTGSDRAWEVIGAIGRGLAYAGTLLAAGGALFLVAVQRPSEDVSADGSERAPLVRLVRLGALLGALAGLVALPVQAALGTGQGALSLFDDGVLSQVAAEGVGHSLLLGLVGLALVAVGVTRSVPATIVGSLVAAGSFAATGHTRAGEASLAATLADVAHLAAAATWAGGLVLLWLTLRRRRRNGMGDDAGAARLVLGFSQLATVAILVVGLAGVVVGWTQVRSLEALTSTRYGLILLAKVAVVAAVAAMGAYNHFRLVPALQQGQSSAPLRRLRDTLRVEVVGVVGVLALTAVLVVLTPARASGGSGVVEVLVDVGDAGSVQVVVAPARAGYNTIHLYTYDPDDRPADIGDSVTLELSLPAAQLGPLSREAVRAGPAHFQLDGNDLAVAGTWDLTVRVRVDRFTEVAGTFQIPVAA